jgi:replicative DNA helicase
VDKSRDYKPRKFSAAPSPASDRVSPQALEAERTILGSMLIDKLAVDIALESLNDGNFYLESHSKIFICMRELSEKSFPIDTITITEQLRMRGWLEDVGAESYIAELAENVATAGNVESYAKIVREKSVLRQLISASAEITTDCFASDREVQEVLDSAEAKIFSISEARMRNRYAHIGELVPHTMEEIETYAKLGRTSGLPTGFTGLDKLTNGLQKGDLVIVGGRPSMGKTSFCLSVAMNVAVKASRSTIIFSLEMGKDQLAQRLLCSRAAIDMQLLRSGHLPTRDYPKLGEAARVLNESPLYIEDTPAITVFELRAMARRLKAQRGLDLIIVDYLQLMTPNVKSDSVQQDISQISRSLKSVARELEVPVIALSQLSRAVESRSDKRPMLSDLRESGAIEQDADLVMFVFREEVYDSEKAELKGKAEIIVGKQRNGPIGTVELTFLKERAAFENLSPRSDLPEEMQ